MKNSLFCKKKYICMKNKAKIYKLLSLNFIVFSVIMILAPFYPWWIFAGIGGFLYLMSKHS
jgi:hypothetical protein